MSLHIHRTDTQPFTHFVDQFLATHRGRVKATFKCSDYRLAWCHRCHTRRRAANLSIQIYYDAVYVFCTNRDECEARRKTARRKAPFPLPERRSAK